MDIDGYWGMDTTRAIQGWLGLPQTGCIYDQWADNKQPGLTSGWYWNYSANGDDTIRGLQRKLGTDVDGIFGYVDICALQNRMGTPVDGYLSAGSPCIKEIQRKFSIYGKLW